MAAAVKIMRGPSKGDLMLALFEEKVVTFKLEGGAEMDVRVRSLANEENWDTVSFNDDYNNGGEPWLIEGEEVSRKGRLHNEDAENPFGDIYHVVYAAYSSASREGVLHFYCHDNGFSGELQHELLRYEWGDRVWGGDGWRTC